MCVVETRSLRKSYGTQEVLHALDLRVPRGALYGFLGPNGAGKSTTLRIVLGLLRASAGEARLFGEDAWTQGPALRRRVGYLPGDIRLYDRLTGRQTLEFFDTARLTDSSAEIRRLRDAFDIDLDKRVRQCSRGMKQKIGLIQALMHRPELVILDEPTISLDPLIREVLLSELRDTSRDGRTVLFSSHTLSEVDELCDWVGILRDGKLIEQQTVDILRTQALRRVELRLSAGHALPDQRPEGLKVLRRDDGHALFTWVGQPAPMLRWLAEQPLDDVSIAPPDLEDLFMAYYGARPQEDA